MFLDSSIHIDDNRLSIPGYSIMRVDHPRGGVLCLYYNQQLPIIQRDDIAHLKEYLVMKITIKNERYLLTHLLGPLAKIVNLSSPFVILLTFLAITLVVSIQ